MVRFEFASDGRIFRLLEDFDQFNDPGEPIPPQIVALTGITDEMVRGQRIEQAAVDRFIADAALIIAHNAAFDRPFVEAHLEGFDRLAWGCSAAQVDWSEAGFESRKLEYLAYRQGFFFDGHRAINDCLAGIHLLAQPLPGDNGNAMTQLLANARATGVRIYAAGSPFETKDILRQRGYRWNPGDDGQPKAWFIDLDAAAMDVELAWLQEHVFHRPVRLPTHKITPFNRFSARL
jgi:DNA polymerase-3 subunit epsilon